MATKKRKAPYIADQEFGMVGGTEEDFKIGRKMYRDGASLKEAEADKREGILGGFLFESVDGRKKQD